MAGEHEWRDCFHPTTQQGGDGCYFFMRCHGTWPERCDLSERDHQESDAEKIARLTALLAERDALRGWQAGQTHYVGCWREHRRCALTTIDFEAARREHAELALREAVAELNRLREGQDDERC